MSPTVILNIVNDFAQTSFRFIFFLCLKVLTRIFYRFDVRRIEPWPVDAWKDVRLAILLNHTSLIEPIFIGALPINYIWHLATHGTFAAADVTLVKPFVGHFIRFLAPKVIPLSRKRDDTWQFFLNEIEPEDTMIFMPEGRMKRPNGLDKDGKPMTVRGGIVDVLTAMRSGRMMICYSGGLHHIQSPGQGLPKLFKTVQITFEALRIEDYLAEYNHPTDLKRLIIQDLEQRLAQCIDRSR